MKQALNPYLPSWEYVPDGEPHIFEDRVYLYGSHDRFDAKVFCVNDYVCWSAPVDDLSDWRYEGVIYKKRQDPGNRLGLHLLFAPDVCQGVDGRYYLYYVLDFTSRVGVAVCDIPAGKYRFYGWVKHRDGTSFGCRTGDQFAFDPAVLVDEDGRIYLYSGTGAPVPEGGVGKYKLCSAGSVVMELEQDMLTIKEEATPLFPNQEEAGLSGHEFFEASSIRKYDGVYYFVYSSKNNHDLCYAIADSPSGPFTYRGVLVDIGDCGIDGRTEENAVNYMANTHGGILRLEDEFYIFYHRHTNRHEYSRQACAERLVRNTDGSFNQAEVTSCGLNVKPLAGSGRYEAYIACNLWAKNGQVGRYDKKEMKEMLREHPYFTQTGKDRESDGDQYIANMKDGATAGFKYFLLQGLKSVSVEVRGREGIMEVSASPRFSRLIAKIPLDASKDYRTFQGMADAPDGVSALYFRYVGLGSVDFRAFTLEV